MDNQIVAMRAKFDEELAVASDVQALEAMYGNDGVEFVVAWNKLYKRTLFKSVLWR